MKQVLPKLKKYSKSINRVLLFIAAIIIISNLLPREGKFRFEFKKSEPWRYETLIAPFDFRIYKTDLELKAESDSILSHFRPYFSKDSLVYPTVVENIAKSIIANRKLLENRYPFLTYDSFIMDSINATISTVLKPIYNKGIVQIPDEYINQASDLEFKLIDKNLAELYSAREFYSSRDAYKRAVEEIDRLLSYKGFEYDNMDGFVSDLKIDEYIVANIQINIERTNEEKEDQLKNMALTEGIVLSGQKVIDKGELVDNVALKKLVSYKKEYESRIGTMSEYNIIYAGQILVTFVLTMSLFLFLLFYRKDVFRNLKHVTFLLLMIVTVIALAYLSFKIEDIPIWVIPFTILPLIVRTFMDSRLAFFFYVVAILLASFFSDKSFEFIFLQIPAGIASIFTLYKMARRSQIVRSALAIFATYSIFYTGLTLIQEGNIESLNYETYIYFAINALLILMVHPLIYVFEKIFDFLSDVTLVELSDTNHPLLRQLAENAPGTFQHSIQVGNLAQEAAYKIGANPLLIRAGAMYHDIGKSVNPYYFTENQTTGINPHQNMDYEDSAKIVIDHIEGGVKIAQKHNLPTQIIDFITTHQGTTKTRYFYNSFINENPDVEPNEKNFTYPGPTPFTKETAILMMADSIEAASRSLKEYTDEAIENLVEKIVSVQMQEGQFQNAPITFREVNKVKAVFKEKLKNIYHARVSYPDIKK
ncbi:HD family phosphohydrolase [Saccharicrinis aurantiacus]|uniref:HD family phosphohydrolase n=1 Tax=Saccharicrinis aurantiacus TaxID=1849719 RepID=UPI0009502047|nr:HDIG domain-containing metalloprotein [Saccharicrinis aurantiacus]